jgi:type II secretion system protein H
MAALTRNLPVPGRRSSGGGLPSSGRSGFTLLELIIVLVLAGLVAALVFPSFSGSIESSRLRSGAAEVRAALTLARTLAASGSRVCAVSFDIERGEYVVDGEARKFLLPEGIRIDAAHVGTAAVDHGTLSVRFFPDGSAEEAEIVLASPAGSLLRVAVDPLTGIAEAGI